jgi:hypothetical protein
MMDTLISLAEEYLNVRDASDMYRSNSLTTVTRYVDFFGGTVADQLSEKLRKNCFDHLGGSALSVNNQRVTIRTIWREAYRRGIAPSPGMDRIPLRRFEREVIQSCTIEEVRALVRAASSLPRRLGGRPLARLVLAGYDRGRLGFRPSAWRPVRLRDVDLRPGGVLGVTQHKTSCVVVHCLHPPTLCALQRVSTPLIPIGL